MSRHGPTLEREQDALAGVLDDLGASRPAVGDDPSAVAALVGELAAMGVWTVGVAEGLGGGGADSRTTGVALERLGRHWPALGWASVQAHAAATVLGGVPEHAELGEQLHAGAASVAVVEADAPHVRLRRTDGLQGEVDRVDAAAESPWLLVLDGDADALLVAPDGMTVEPVRTTGLAGALTRSMRVAAGPGDVAELSGLDLGAVRARLWLGVAAVAAGLAGAAADAALAYASDRRQFGDTLTALPTVRQSLLTQAGRAATGVASALSGERAPVDAHAAAREACEAAVDVAAAALQSHGGYGYLVEYPAERMLRDAVSLRAATGVHPAAVPVARAHAGLPTDPTLRKDES
ncbi:acyl-CoA dehydrogenase family protein [Aeromicrobium sp. IC_218]|uniref:acyl-CoA dehydrogenase family protein n=1 Tax=Aeromicrobium sp. IC_218 TaxID=2545468 RepID=UPI00103C5620|nr:acyl-CoA dehydrogenase family protein [Aeromicrobium sp. IC_218]TCI96387.1 acyl-CoA dehydrogenase [Aeromicrobium sp. IC_218]